MRDIFDLQEHIGYTFKDSSLLLEALTHRSFANENLISKVENYERLEFLGDAVLELLVSEYLYIRENKSREGAMTKMRASMVCEQSLAFCARDLGLGEYIRLGKGEQLTGGRDRDSITSDTMEAVIGAIYLDGGIECARKFVEKFVLEVLEKKSLFIDCKTKLQEHMHVLKKTNCVYALVNEVGPEHSKTFTVNVLIDGEVIGTGMGKTKKAAEQEAAYNALKVLREEQKD